MILIESTPLPILHCIVLTVGWSLTYLCYILKYSLKNYIFKKCFSSVVFIFLFKNNSKLQNLYEHDEIKKYIQNRQHFSEQNLTSSTLKFHILILKRFSENIIIFVYNIETKLHSL